MSISAFGKRRSRRGLPSAPSAGVAGPLLLDGGVGHEWKRRHGDESFLGGCLACGRDPAGVTAVHAAFFDAGAALATTNSFVATPHHVRREAAGGEDYVALARAAARCALAAKRGGDGRLVAGSLPPLGECYAARGGERSSSSDDERVYEALATALADEGVDVLLAETLSSSAEAVAALRGAAFPEAPPVWCCLTLADDASARLRSGEALGDALRVVVAAARDAAGARLEGIGVNCCSPAAVDAALPVVAAAAAAAGGLEVVVYANAFQGTTSAWLASVGRPDCCAGPGALHDAADYDDDGVMTPGAYAARCVAWRDAGATVIGGCCGVTPSHVRAVRDALADEAIVVKLPT